MAYIFTLDPEDRRTILYYRSFLCKCQKKFWCCFLPVFFIYLGMALFTLVYNFQLPLKIIYILCLIISSSLWAFFIPYIGKFSHLLFLHRSGIGKKDTLIFHVYENRITVTATTGNTVHYYKPDVYKMLKKARKSKDRWNKKEFEAPIAEIYECDAGIYFASPLQLFPVAYISKSNCDFEEYSSLSRILKEKFSKHYHQV